MCLIALKILMQDIIASYLPFDFGMNITVNICSGQVFGRSTLLPHYHQLTLK